MAIKDVNNIKGEVRLVNELPFRFNQASEDEYLNLALGIGMGASSYSRHNDALSQKRALIKEAKKVRLLSARREGAKSFIAIHLERAAIRAAISKKGLLKTVIPPSVG